MSIRTYVFLVLGLFVTIPKLSVGQSASPINVEQFRNDWTIFNVTAPDGPPHPAPVGGILIQWTQEGLDYVASLTKLAFTRILAGVQFPDNHAEDGSFSATNIRVKQFDEPQVFIKFLRGTGIGTKILLPKLEVQADYEMDSGWISSSGKAHASATNVVILMLLDIQRGPIGHPTFDFPYCDAKMGSFRIAFSDTDSFAGSMLNSFRGTIESFVSTQMGETMCTSARNATDVFEILFIDPWSGPWLFDPDVLCPNMTFDTTATGKFALPYLCNDAITRFQVRLKSNCRKREVPLRTGFSKKSKDSRWISG